MWSEKAGYSLATLKYVFLILFLTLAIEYSQDEMNL
jgi:hypothetical protein